MTAARPETESAAERTRRLWEGSFAGTARALLAELDLNDEAITVLLPWVTDRVRATMRNAVRDVEETVWGTGPKYPRHAIAVRTQTGALPVLTDLERLLSLPVLVPIPGNGTQAIIWRDMTVADHEARIGMLRRPLKGIQNTIRRHEWSIAEIRRYGVNTLGDIPVDLLRGDL